MVPKYLVGTSPNDRGLESFFFWPSTYAAGGLPSRLQGHSEDERDVLHDNQETAGVHIRHAEEIVQQTPHRVGDVPGLQIRISIELELRTSKFQNLNLRTCELANLRTCELF